MKKLVLAITSCIVGAAHTYMAATALEEEAKKRGYKIKVEKQGGSGINDKFTQNDINNASVIIFACDLSIREKERFSKIPQIVAKGGSSEAIKDPSSLLEKAEKIMLNKNIDENIKTNDDKKESWIPKDTNNKYDFKSFFNGGLINFKKSFFTGLSYMIPVIVAGGMILALIAAIQGLNDAANNNKTLNDFKNWSIFLMQYFPTILAMFIAFGYADKPGITAGFASGVIMFKTYPNTSFLGGIIAGVVAGYVTKAVVALIKPNKTFQAFVNIMVWPMISVSISGILIYFAFGYPAHYLSLGIKELLVVLKNSGAAAFAGFLIAGFAMIDCGGVLSKSSFAAVLVVIKENPEYWVAYASGILGVSLGLLLSTFTHKKYYTKEAIASGRTAWIPAGIGGISEGSLGALFSGVRTVPISYFLGAGTAGAFIVSIQLQTIPSPSGGIVLPLVLNSWRGSLGLAILMYYTANLIAAITCYIFLTLFKWLEYRKPFKNGWVENGVINYPKNFEGIFKKSSKIFIKKFLKK